MGIQVECPNGHSFRVKDKYAGKKGLCPQCDGQVIVLVPDLLSQKSTHEAYRRAVVEEQRAAHRASELDREGHALGDSGDSSVFDDAPAESAADTSGSLLGSSVIRHHIKCGKCHEKVPMWFAKCPNCGTFVEH